MKLTRLRLTPWSTTEAAGVRHAHRSWTTRAGLLLELESNHGLVGHGEASPLPGYSPDALEDCERILLSLAPSSWPLPTRPLDIDSAWLEIARHVPARFPAARCAVEMALADLYAQSARLPLWKVLHAWPSSSTAPPPTPRWFAALLTEASPEALRGEAVGRIAEGYRALKLKSNGEHPLGVEHQRWSAARDVALAHGATLRLDANQSWPEGELDSWLGAAADLGIEFVEEPVPLYRPWRGAPWPIPTALDESLARLERWPDRDELALRNVQAIVVKPMLLGLRRSLETAAWARSVGLAVVVTHCFDGPYGYALGLALAAAIGSPNHAHGLAPHPILAIRWPEAIFDGCTAGMLRLSSRVGLGVDTVPREEE